MLKILDFYIDKQKSCITRKNIKYAVNSRFKKDLKLQIHQHKAFFSDVGSDLRKEKITFLNRKFTYKGGRFEKFQIDPTY